MLFSWCNIAYSGLWKDVTSPHFTVLQTTNAGDHSPVEYVCLSIYEYVFVVG